MENKAKQIKLSGKPGGRHTLSSHPESHPVGPVSFRGMSMKCLCFSIWLQVICLSLLQRADHERPGKQEFLEYISCWSSKHNYEEKENPFWEQHETLVSRIIRLSHGWEKEKGSDSLMNKNSHLCFPLTHAGHMLSSIQTTRFSCKFYPIGKGNFS